MNFRRLKKGPSASTVMAKDSQGSVAGWAPRAPLRLSWGSTLMILTFAAVAWAWIPLRRALSKRHSGRARLFSVCLGRA
jgi:hypothetical protein